MTHGPIFKLSATTLSAVALSASASLAGDPDAGLTSFETVCSECHAAASDVAGKLQGDDAEAKTLWLDTFLAEHFVPEAETRANLAAYLLSVSD